MTHMTRFMVASWKIESCIANSLFNGYIHQWRREIIFCVFRETNNVFPCFQVQSDHYEEFFAPELDKHGYQALYKRKTNEVVKPLLVIVVIHVSSSIFIINA